MNPPNKLKKLIGNMSIVYIIRYISFVYICICYGIFTLITAVKWCFFFFLLASRWSQILHDTVLSNSKAYCLHVLSHILLNYALHANRNKEKSSLEILASVSQLSKVGKFLNFFNFVVNYMTKRWMHISKIETNQTINGQIV